MNKLPKPVLVAIVIASCVFVITLIFIGIGGDIYDLNHGLSWISLAKRIQWESILAGALGLAGGLFVIHSTRQQIAAAKEAALEASKQVNTRRADEANAPLELAMYAVSDFGRWISQKRKVVDSANFQLQVNNHMDTNLPQVLDGIKAEFAHRCDHIAMINQTHAVTRFNYEVYTALMRLAGCNETAKPYSTWFDDEGMTGILNEHVRRLQEAAESVNAATKYIENQIETTRSQLGAAP